MLLIKQDQNSQLLLKQEKKTKIMPLHQKSSNRRLIPIYILTSLKNLITIGQERSYNKYAFK